MPDFTLKTYTNLCHTILKHVSGAVAVADSDAVADHCPPTSDLCCLTVRMAELENELGIRSTYYVRSIPKVFDPDAIRRLGGTRTDENDQDDQIDQVETAEEIDEAVEKV